VGGYGEQLRTGLGEVTVEVREAKVVADRQPEPAGGGRRDHGPIARNEDVGFLRGVAADHARIEKMDLVVSGDARAAAVEEQAAVCELAVLRPHGQRPCEEEDPQLRGEARKVPGRDVLRQRPRVPAVGLRPLIAKVHDLGQGDQRGALAMRPPDQRFRAAEIRGDVRSRPDLHTGDSAHCPTSNANTVHDSACTASIASWLARSSTASKRTSRSAIETEYW